MLSPEGRVIMISGAARGIGLATSRLLAERGYSLSLGVRDPKAIEPGIFGGDVLVVRWDATEAATSEAWAVQTVERFGRIDGIVLNAGVALKAGLEEVDEAAFDAMWEVNFKGPLRLGRSPDTRHTARQSLISVNQSGVDSRKSS